jgi:hypothetical protein
MITLVEVRHRSRRIREPPELNDAIADTRHARAGGDGAECAEIMG